MRTIAISWIVSSERRLRKYSETRPAAEAHRDRDGIEGKLRRL